MAAAYGPRQSERRFGFADTGRLNVEARATSFAAPGRAGQPQAQRAAERELQEAVARALEAAVLLDRFPKAVVDVYVVVLESGGSDLAVAICAASLALADAGVELLDLVPACAVALVGGSTLLLDPSADEAHAAGGTLTLAMMPGPNEVTQLALGGEWAPAAAREATELAMGGCAQLRAAMRATLLAAAQAAAPG